jgi:DNA processing protein
LSVETIPSSSPEYPEALRDLGDAPRVLWAIGDRAALHDPVVAVVGTRRATSYGIRVTRDLVSSLTRAGACVVSGMALGIDGVAHRAALDAGGRTVAVLGTGADVPYPRSHLGLYNDIVRRGMILSELPPGAKSHGGSFPNRNRIIAALAKLVIVVEAPHKSGALYTAQFAMDLGRDLAIVPGPIDSPQSAGSNLLLRDGAHPILTFDDAAMLAGLSPQRRTGPNLDDVTEMRVWNALGDGAATLDELCARSALPVSECLTAVTGLELRGAVECALTGEVRRR